MTDFGLAFHRASMLVIAPVVWVLGTLAHAVCAPFAAAEDVYLGVKRHWSDR